MAFVLLSGLVLLREPREGLFLVAAGFVLHALVDIAHRPGWLSPDLAPRWYVVHCKPEAANTPFAALSDQLAPAVARVGA